MSLRISPSHFLISEPVETIGRIRRFLKNQRDRTGTTNFVLGMSGGLDSSVTAALCAQAIGGKHVIGVHMPERETRDENNLHDAKNVAEKFRIRFELVDITDLVMAASRTLSGMGWKRSPVPYGNVKARLRATVLYYLANKDHGLVVGTGDKSEIMLGYFTKFGDGACDIQPLADLYKSSVRDLAGHLGLPKRVYSKPPSPGLWPGQTAEGELGLEYEKLDTILWGLERWMSPADIARETGLSLGIVRKTRNRWISSEHKRRPPLPLKMGYRTPGADMRLPYSMG